MIMEVKVTFASLFILTFLYRCFLFYLTNNMDDHVRIGNITNIPRMPKIYGLALLSEPADLLLITTGIDH